MRKQLKKSRKAGAKKLEAKSKTARNKIRLFNKFIKEADVSHGKQLEYNTKIDKIKSSVDEKIQKIQFLCDKKKIEAKEKVQKKIQNLDEKISIESEKEKEALINAEQAKPSLDTEDLAMNPKFEKQTKKKKEQEQVVAQVPRATYANVLMGQTQTAGKKLKRKSRKYK